MKPKTLNLLVAFSMISILTIAFSSCKKEDKAGDNSTERERQLAIEAVKREYGNIGRAYVRTLNKTADKVYYRNSSGQMVQKISRSQNMDAVCIYDCSNASSPSDLLSTYTIAYIQRNYECGSATLSSLTARWVISVP